MAAYTCESFAGNTFAWFLVELFPHSAKRTVDHTTARSAPPMPFAYIMPAHGPTPCSRRATYQGLKKLGQRYKPRRGRYIYYRLAFLCLHSEKHLYWAGRSQSKSVGMPNRIALFHREIFSLPRTVTTPKIPDRCWLLSRRRSL